MKTLHETVQTINQALETDTDFENVISKTDHPAAVVGCIDDLQRSGEYDRAVELIECYPNPDTLYDNGLGGIQDDGFVDAVEAGGERFIAAYRSYDPDKLMKTLEEGQVAIATRIAGALSENDASKGVQKFIKKASSNDFDQGAWSSYRNSASQFQALSAAVEQAGIEQSALIEALDHRHRSAYQTTSKYGFLPWAVEEAGIDLRELKHNFIEHGFNNENQQLVDYALKHNETFPDKQTVFKKEDTLRAMSEDFERLLDKGFKPNSPEVAATLLSIKKYDLAVRVADRTADDASWNDPTQPTIHEVLDDDRAVQSMLQSEQASEIVRVLLEHGNPETGFTFQYTPPIGEEALVENPEAVRTLIEAGAISTPLHVAEASIATDGAPGWSYYRDAIDDEAAIERAAMFGFYRTIEAEIEKNGATTDDYRAILHASMELSEDDRPSAEAYRKTLEIGLRGASLDAVYAERYDDDQAAIEDDTTWFHFTDDPAVLRTILTESDLDPARIGVEPAVDMTDDLDELDRPEVFAELIEEGLPFPSDRDARMRRAAELPDPSVIEAVDEQDRLRFPAFNGALKSNNPAVLQAVIDRYDLPATKTVDNASRTIVDSDGAYTNLLYVREQDWPLDIDAEYRINNMDTDAHSSNSVVAQQAVEFVRSLDASEAAELRELLTNAVQLDRAAIQKAADRSLPPMFYRDIARAIDRADDPVLKQLFVEEVTLVEESDTIGRLESPLNEIANGWLDQAREETNVELRRALGEYYEYNSKDLEAAIKNSDRVYFDLYVEQADALGHKLAVENILTSDAPSEWLGAVELGEEALQEALTSALDGGAPVEAVWSCFEQYDYTITDESLLAALVSKIALSDPSTNRMEAVIDRIDDQLTIDTALDDRHGSPFMVDRGFLNTALHEKALTVAQLDELAGRIEGRFEYWWSKCDVDDDEKNDPFVIERPEYLRVLLCNDALSNPEKVVLQASRHEAADEPLSFVEELPEAARYDFVDYALLDGEHAPYEQFLDLLLETGVDLSQKQETLVEYLTGSAGRDVLDVLREHDMSLTETLNDANLQQLKDEASLKTARMLIDEGVPAGDLNNELVQQLIDYPTQENLDTLRALIEAGADVPEVRQRDMKAIAAQPGYTDLLQTLIENGGELGSTVLYNAVRHHNDHEIVETILDNYSPNANVKARTFNKMIDDEASLAGVRNAPFMAQNGADPNREKLKELPLVKLMKDDANESTTTRFADPIRALQWLMEAGADPTARDLKSLRTAIRNDRPKSLSVMFDEADLDTSELNELVVTAINEENTEALRQVIQAGAEPERGFRRVCENNDHERLSVLLEEGADPAANNEQLLLEAAFHNREELVEWLLESGEFERHRTDPTYLYAAVKNPFPSMIGNRGAQSITEMLLDDGAVFDGDIGHPELNGYGEKLDQMGSGIGLIQREAAEGDDGEFDLLKLVLDHTGRPTSSFMSWLDREVPNDQSDVIVEEIEEYLTKRQKNSVRVQS